MSEIEQLLRGARGKVKTARAEISDWQEPHLTLKAWENGPWAEAAKSGDPTEFGMPDKPFELVSRQWIDVLAGRAREESGDLVVVRDGPRWWRAFPGTDTESGEGPGSTVTVAVTLAGWLDPAPLADLLAMEVTGDEDVCGISALTVRATARDGEGMAADLAPLGWAADEWILNVDARRGVLLGSTAYVGGKVFKRVVAKAIAFDEPLDEKLFSPLP
jgi:hypothetical protein